MNRKLIQKGLLSLALMAIGLVLSHTANAATTLMLREHGNATYNSSTDIYSVPVFTSGGDVPGGISTQFGHSEWKFNSTTATADVTIYRDVKTPYGTTKQKVLTMSGITLVEADSGLSPSHLGYGGNVGATSKLCLIDAPVVGSYISSSLDFRGYTKAYGRCLCESNEATDAMWFGNCLWVFSDVAL